MRASVSFLEQSMSLLLDQSSRSQTSSSDSAKPMVLHAVHLLLSSRAREDGDEEPMVSTGGSIATGEAIIILR